MNNVLTFRPTKITPIRVQEIRKAFLSDAAIEDIEGRFGSGRLGLLIELFRDDLREQERRRRAKGIAA